MSKINDKTLYDKLIQEEREYEDMQDYKHEMMIRNDKEVFDECFSEEADELIHSMRTLKELHEQYGYDFYIEDYLDQV